VSVGQYVYERFSRAEVDRFFQDYVKSRLDWAYGDFTKPGLPDAPCQKMVARDMHAAANRGPVSVSLLLQPGQASGVPHKISLSAVFYDSCPWVDLVWTIADKGPDPWPEAGRLGIPLNVANPSFRLARPGAVVDPSRDLVRATNHEVFSLNGGMAVVDAAGAGVGVCPMDAPLVSLGHTGICRYSKEWTARPPVVFVNLFNNQWSTNFPQWVGGAWSSRIRLWPIGKFSPLQDLVAPSAEARSPLIAAHFEGAPGKLAASRAGVVVTAFGANPDGEGLVLRLWEQAGADGECTVTLPAGIRPPAVQPCDLCGTQAGQPITVRDGRFTLTLGRYAPASILLSAGGPGACVPGGEDHFLWKGFFCWRNLCTSGQNSHIRLPVTPPSRLVYTRSTITEP
jgi:hypothetical protein